LILFPVKGKNKLIALNNNNNNNTLSERNPFVCLTIVVGRKKQKVPIKPPPLDPIPLLNWNVQAIYIPLQAIKQLKQATVE
jgi:hypothetical protein